MTTYITWLMMWITSKADWWTKEHFNGAKLFLENKWQGLDWCNTNHVDEILRDIKEAGVNVVVCDLTNGWGWQNETVKNIQKHCLKYNLKMCIALNHHGDIKKYEVFVKDIWELFAGPQAEYANTYFYKDNKPLIVHYVIREWYQNALKSNLEYSKKFSTVWTSGEDSEINKWGWQLEPWAASIPSEDSMFVTASIKWAPEPKEAWIPSLSWLDYNFALAKKANPKHIIVGSYDDLCERNVWFKADTANCEKYFQLRDIYGNISVDAFYSRVKQWISGKVHTVEGGILPDGCYTISNNQYNMEIAPFGYQIKPESTFILNNPSVGLDNYFWLYHLGDNIYRIIKLNTCLSLSSKINEPYYLNDNKLRQAMVQNCDSQKWKISKNDKSYMIENVAEKKVLDVKPMLSDKFQAVILTDKKNSSSESWTFHPVINIC